MPELPDVEGFRRVLERAAGHPIEHVDVADAGVLRDTDPDALRAAVVGRSFGAPHRHGKWLVGPLHGAQRHRRDEPSLVFHFGMTGALQWVTRDDDRHKHDRVVFVTGRGDLRYRDMRKLQGLRLASDDGHVEALLGDIGPDAAEVSLEEFRERLCKTRRELKPALMDQRLVAGLGNLLADEILWRARLNPARSTTDLSADEQRRLHRKLTYTLRNAIPDGRVPNRSSWLTGHRDDLRAECPRCGSRLRAKRVSGRRTVWCPRCQPA